MIRIQQIMRTNVDETPLPHSISQDTLISHILPGQVEEEIRYQVTDQDGRKVGEVWGRDLLYLSQSLRQLELGAIIDTIEDGVIVVDADGRICFENEAYSRIIGVPMRKTIGRDLHHVEPDALLLKVLKTGEPAARKRHLIKSVHKYVSMRMFPIRREGAVVGAYSVFRDVTELRRLGKEVERVTQVAEELTSQLDVAFSRFQMIGQDPRFRTLLSRAATAAQTDATVLIRGENGVGKEGFAKLIHQASPRRNKPMITVNCAAIPETLIESELFGYEEGTFTGAKKGGKVGKFELAQGGTLFLDEVGDMPLLMQSKLLRVLQDGEIEKLGREENIPVDVRIVAATNQPLEELVAQKKFRADLYYRLNVISVTVPPLRERRDDILPLANHFLEEYNQRYGKKAALSRSAGQLLRECDWPGNVRQLRNCIESAVILCSGTEITPADLTLDSPEAVRSASAGQTPLPVGPLREATLRFERQMIREVLEQCGGDVDLAAGRLEISRRTLYRKLSDKNDTSDIFDINQ